MSISRPIIILIAFTHVVEGCSFASQHRSSCLVLALSSANRMLLNLLLYIARHWVVALFLIILKHGLLSSSDFFLSIWDDDGLMTCQRLVD